MGGNLCRSCLLPKCSNKDPDIFVGVCDHGGQRTVEYVTGEAVSKCDDSLYRAFKMFGQPASRLGALSRREALAIQELITKRALMA